MCTLSPHLKKNFVTESESKSFTKMKRRYCKKIRMRSVVHVPKNLKNENVLLLGIKNVYFIEL